MNRHDLRGKNLLPRTILLQTRIPLRVRTLGREKQVAERLRRNPGMVRRVQDRQGRELSRLRERPPAIRMPIKVRSRNPARHLPVNLRRLRQGKRHQVRHHRVQHNLVKRGRRKHRPRRRLQVEVLTKIIIGPHYGAVSQQQLRRRMIPKLPRQGMEQGKWPPCPARRMRPALEI
jgi:hypothetical protein